MCTPCRITGTGLLGWCTSPVDGYSAPAMEWGDARSASQGTRRDHDPWALQRAHGDQGWGLRRGGGSRAVSAYPCARRTMTRGEGGWEGIAIVERPRPSHVRRPAEGPDAAARRRQERGWPPSGLGHHGRAAKARCPQRPGTERRSVGTPIIDNCWVNLSPWTCGRESRHPSVSPCCGKKGLSLQPATVPRGRPWGEPCSIPRGPPGQGRDPQVSRTETLESNFALECEGWRQGAPSRRRGCVRASPESRAARAATIAWRRQPTAMSARYHSRDHPQPPCCGSVAYPTRRARFDAWLSEASRLVKPPSGEQWLDPSRPPRAAGLRLSHRRRPRGSSGSTRRVLPEAGTSSQVSGREHLEKPDNTLIVPPPRGLREAPWTKVLAHL